MSKKDFMTSIESVINDWKSTSFNFFPQQYVPGLDDSNLTYGNGQEKKSIEINTCVLFVDIRNSVQLTKDKQDRTMGRLYFRVRPLCVVGSARRRRVCKKYNRRSCDDYLSSR